MKLIILSIFAFVLISAEDQYPMKWVEIDYKAIIKNDRLFKKYKDCYMTDTATSCPPIVQEAKRVVPEMLETLCGKCTEQHIEYFRNALEYLCQTRRADFDEGSKHFDPDGSIKAKLTEKYGKIDCDIY